MTDSHALVIADTPRSEVQFGVMPTTLDGAWRLAKAFSQSTLVPQAFQGHVEDTLVALQYGIELGFAPMQALQSIAVINGRPSVYGDGFLALLMASPLYQDHEEYFLVGDERCDDITIDQCTDTTRAVCTFVRKGKPQPVTRTFSVADAKRAKKKGAPLWGSTGPWTDYPARMLRMRARGFAGRDCFPDVLRGIKSSEEVRDYDEPDAPPAPPLPVPLPRPRRSTHAALAAPAAPVPVESTPPAAAPSPFRQVHPPAAAPTADTRPLTPVDVTEGLEPVAPLTVTTVEPKPWQDRTYYVITFSDGRTASTWAPELADLASEAQRQQTAVTPTIEAINGKRKLTALAEA